MITFRWYIFRTTVRGVKFEYKFRGLTKHELAVSAEYKTNVAAENFLLSRAVEGDHDWSSLPAGVVELLLAKVLHYTGLSDDGLTLKEAEYWITSQEGQLELMAMSVFPWCSKEYLDNCDPFYYAKTIVGGRYCFETALQGMHGQPQGNTQSSQTTIPMGENREQRVNTEYVRFK